MEDHPGLTGAPDATSTVPERHASYTGDRNDLVALLPQVDGPVLDVGCSTGTLGGRLRNLLGVSVTGVERDHGYAAQAGRVLDRCLEADAIEGMQQLHDEGETFAAAILGDVLEHLEDPWAAFDLAASLVRAGGWILVSVPNVGHWSTFVSLATGRWPRRARGIHDETHLRFFARKDVQDLMNRPPARLVAYRRVYRLSERPYRINRLAPVFGWIVPDLFTYQFLLLSRVEERADQMPSAPPLRVRAWSTSGATDEVEPASRSRGRRGTPQGRGHR